ncbi:Divergent AAA domain protein [Mycobacterium basiliense]|uniref:Divergent AAA domain protein n=1 Tax=Mycobacterium basiliense TaxID=2094119 RepID=A0A3S4BGA1_9MYCO|nr:ATP-binding protein [Mycobacterium basiliense]VDM89988.1 Divergent AAA domain protein [Mycobacterium basiliense]
MIVPDGRTDYEKLQELLGNPEETHLDLKASVNLGAAEDRLKFVKDVVTMSNRPPGGYLLIGVDDAGNPCMAIGTIQNRRDFDGAKLGDLVRKCIEGEIHLRVQIHEHDNTYEIVMIYVEHHRDGLPVPFSKDGQYPDLNGKSVTVFRDGELYVREGAQNVPIRHAHWQDILSARDQRIRNEASEFAQQLLREFLAARVDSAGDPADVPLLMDMDDHTFANAEVALLRSNNNIRLGHFIRSLTQSAKPTLSLDDYESAMDKWVIFCVQALYFERADLVGQAIRRVCDAYTKLGVGVDATRKRLAVVIRIYVIGSLAVRLEAWETITSLSLQPVPSETYGADYMYSSWIRHGQVAASRANLTKERHGFLISAARELIVEHPAMRPDLTAADATFESDVTTDDLLLNSLCQFDFAYCIIVLAKGTAHGEAWPSSVAFDERRVTPMARRIVEETDIRNRMIPETSNADIAHAIRETYDRAIGESLKYGGWWGGPPPSIQHFIDQYDTGSA